MENKVNLIIDVEETPKKKYQWFLFALQHVLGVLVGTITVPLIIPGMPVAAAMLSAGLGTLLYILITKKKSPVFLSSNFSFIAPISSALAIGGITNAMGQPGNYAALLVGMAFVGLVYLTVALVVKFTGTAWIDKLLPTTVIGPTIMVIGLALAGSAVNNLTTVITSDGPVYNLIAILCGLFSLFVTAFCAHYGEGKMIGLIPFVIGMLAGYLLAMVFTLIGYTACGNEYFKIIDFKPFIDTFSAENIGIGSFFNYRMFVPNDKESFIFLRFEEIAQFNWSAIGTIALLFIPISVVGICEHIGDHKNLSNTIGRDLLGKEPGLTRTLIGDGVASAVSGEICGISNTTYGQSIAIIGTTRVASTNVLILAAIIMVVSSFITPITILLQTIPPCLTGGQALVLYGYISLSGMRVLLTSDIDFNKNKNIFIVSAILVSGIGGFALKFGDPLNPLIEISPIALAMILGIILNVSLKDSKEDKELEKQLKEKPKDIPLDEHKD